MPLTDFEPTEEPDPSWKLHPDDTMFPIDRVRAVIDLKEPDRVPINANMSLHAYHMMGLNTMEGVWGMEDPDKALREVFNRYGGWDHLEFVGGLGAPNPFPSTGNPIYQKVKVPGIDLDLWAPAVVQHEEDPPLIGVNGYDQILNEGFFRFINFRKLGYLGLLNSADSTFWKSHVQNLKPIVDYWLNRKISFMPTHLNQPFEIISLMRNTKNFLTDLIRYKDKIKQVLDMMIDGYIAIAKRMIINKKLQLPEKYNLTEILCLSGGGGTSKDARRMYSPRTFEELYFPYLKKLIVELHKVGYQSVLHLDASWTVVLEYFKEIPKGAIAWIETDSTTDLVKAKEILGGHMCIGGDIPATILTQGSPHDVEKYVKEKLKELAPGGGYIVTSGCEIPIEAKFENVKKLIDTTKEFGRYKR
ncbi:MAG: uroporphyrinogen decarboxylase family protein [Candidatus Ranarchaeia archaeon]